MSIYIYIIIYIYNYKGFRPWCAHNNVLLERLRIRVMIREFGTQSGDHKKSGIQPRHADLTNIPTTRYAEFAGKQPSQFRQK